MIGCLWVKCMVIALIEITSKYKCNKLRENIALVAVHLDTGFDNFSFGGLPPCETHEKISISSFPKFSISTAFKAQIHQIITKFKPNLQSTGNPNPTSCIRKLWKLPHNNFIWNSIFTWKHIKKAKRVVANSRFDQISKNCLKFFSSSWLSHFMTSAR